MSTGLFRLDGHVAVVIGGTGALGSCMARGLAKAGATVIIGGPDQKLGQACIKRIASSDTNITYLPMNVLDPASLVAAHDQTLNQHGTIDVLLNAAGGNHPQATLAPNDDFCDLSRDAWQYTFDLNLAGGVLTPCQVFGKSMVTAGRGSIINIASMAGMIPLSRVAAYSAAKSAVINLTRFLARQWACSGVRVNAISPGFFPSDQNRKLLFDDEKGYTERGAQIIGHTPMARFGDPEELVGAAIWLASSKASSFVTGQNIAIDGGFSSSTI